MQEVIGSVVNGVKEVVKEEFEKCVNEWTEVRKKEKKRTNPSEMYDSETDYNELQRNSDTDNKAVPEATNGKTY